MGMTPTAHSISPLRFKTGHISPSEYQHYVDINFSFSFESDFLSVEAKPYVGLNICVHYSSGPNASSPPNPYTYHSYFHIESTVPFIKNYYVVWCINSIIGKIVYHSFLALCK